MKHSHSLSKISLSLAIASLPLLLSACDDGPNQRSIGFNCAPGEFACSSDGLSLLTCVDNKWESQTCKTGACVILNAKAQCLPEVTPNPETNPPKPETKTVKSTTCSGDNIAITYSDDSTETKSCLNETGINSKCKSYNNGLVGCEMPSQCDDAIFTENGTCLGQRLAYCDNAFVVPKPVIWNCASIGRVCASYLNKASCFDTCDSSEPEFSCANSSSSSPVVTHCVNVNGARLKDQRSAVCSGNELISCDGKQISKTTCDPDSVCVESKAICAKVCAESDLDKLRCDTEGKMSQCQRIDDGSTVYYAWISVGTSECIGNTLNLCNGSEVTQANCVEKQFTTSSGETIATHGKCVNNYNISGVLVDTCIPAYDGQPCENLTDAGRCVGNTLQYCYLDDNIIAQKDCPSLTETGETACSVYAGFADCRKPCSEIGEAKCTVVEQEDGSTETYLSLCVQDEASTALKTYLIASAGCIGDTLYSCNGETVVKTDCATNGGVCDSIACKYPVCSLSSSEDCVNGTTCVSDDDGLVKGLTSCSK